MYAWIVQTAAPKIITCAGMIFIQYCLLHYGTMCRSCHQVIISLTLINDTKGKNMFSLQ